MELDPYVVLGVARDCSTDELKSAYRRLARENHPDIAPDKSAATYRMTQINAAWALVGDPQKRVGFDLRWRLEERERAAKARAARPTPTASAPPRPQPAPKPKTPRPTHPTSGKANATSRERTSPPKGAPQSTPATAKTSARRGAPVSRHARLAEASRLLFKHNKPNEAIELCRSILKTDFRNIPARELMGEAYLRLGQTEKALAVWEQALVLAPGNMTLRRRWLGLMSPETRAAHERKVPPQPSGPTRTTPVSASTSHSRAQTTSQRGLVSRLLARLGGKR